MQAKIMLLPASSKGKTLCSYAEELFLEISASFGHSLSTVREKIGEDSVRLFDVPLTQETANACKNCNAVFLADGDCDGSRALWHAMGLPLRVRSFMIPASLANGPISARQMYICQPTALDQDTLFPAVRQAMQLASQMELPFCHVAPTGNNRFQWEAQVKESVKKYPSLSYTSLSAPEAVRRIIETPYHIGVMMCPPYAGSILETAAMSLFPFPGIQFDFSLQEGTGIYAPRLSCDANAMPEPFGTAWAVAHMLRTSLRMSREAACLEAAIENVLVSGWRTAGMPCPGETADGNHIIQLICEQLAVAGEFLTKH